MSKIERIAQLELQIEDCESEIGYQRRNGKNNNIDAILERRNRYHALIEQRNALRAQNSEPTEYANPIRAIREMKAERRLTDVEMQKSLAITKAAIEAELSKEGPVDEQEVARLKQDVKELRAGITSRKIELYEIGSTKANNALAYATLQNQYVALKLKLFEQKIGRYPEQCETKSSKPLNCGALFEGMTKRELRDKLNNAEEKVAELLADNSKNPDEIRGIKNDVRRLKLILQANLIWLDTPLFSKLTLFKKHNHILKNKFPEPDQTVKVHHSLGGR